MPGPRPIYRHQGTASSHTHRQRLAARIIRRLQALPFQAQRWATMKKPVPLAPPLQARTAARRLRLPPLIAQIPGLVARTSPRSSASLHMHSDGKGQCPYAVLDFLTTVNKIYHVFTLLWVSMWSLLNPASFPTPHPAFVVIIEDNWSPLPKPDACLVFLTTTSISLIKYSSLALHLNKKMLILNLVIIFINVFHLSDIPSPANSLQTSLYLQTVSPSWHLQVSA